MLVGVYNKIALLKQVKTTLISREREMKFVLLDGKMHNLPDVALGELWDHLLAEDPVGDGRALHDLSLEQLVDQNYQHLME